MKHCSLPWPHPVSLELNAILRLPLICVHRRPTAPSGNALAIRGRRFNREGVTGPKALQIASAFDRVADSASQKDGTSTPWE